MVGETGDRQNPKVTLELIEAGGVESAQRPTRTDEALPGEQGLITSGSAKIKQRLPLQFYWLYVAILSAGTCLAGVLLYYGINSARNDVTRQFELDGKQYE